MSFVSRTKGQIYCPLHPKKKLVVLCQKCKILICQTCMLKEHLGHPGHELEGVAEEKYRHIDDFITKVEETTIPKVHQNIQDAELDARTKEEDLNSKINKAYEQEKYLHQLVTDNRIKTVTHFKSEIATIHQNLSEFQTDSVTFITQIETSVTDCKDVKRSDNDILIIDEANEVDQLDIKSLPVYTKLSTSTVIFGSNPVEGIEKAFGKLSGKKHPDLVPQLSKQVSSEQASLDIVKKPNEFNQAKEVSSSDLGANGRRTKKTRELLSDPIITKSIELSERHLNLAIQKNGTIWYCTRRYKVYQIDLKGNTKEYDIRLSDLAVHPTTDQVYGANNKDKCVYKYSKGLFSGYKLSIAFKTVLKPCCLAILKNGHFVIGFYDSEVNVYTEDGTVVRTIEIKSSQHISVSPNTGDIAVACGGTGLCVVDQKLKTKYNYRDIKYCTDAVFNSFGHLLIIDLNEGVHVLTAESGKHLKTIETGTFGNIGCVSRLTISNDGQLVVGTCEPNQFVFAKYLN